MQTGKFRLYNAIIAGGLCIAVAIAIVTDTPIIALAAVVVAIVLAFIIERSNNRDSTG